MARRTAGAPKNRPTLDRGQVLRTAVALADAEGIEALSMRNLAGALGVQAMSLYNHVDNKDDLLEGIVDLVFLEFEAPAGSGLWRPILRRSAIAAHAALVRHPWVAALSESRMQSGPARLAYYDAILGLLRRSGFSARSAYHANLTLDSYLYGFTLQQTTWPDPSTDDPEFAARLREAMADDTYPHLVEVAAMAADGLDLTHDFEVGLDLVLDGLERLRDAG